ncbi:nucleotide exchange factor GrpE [Patescibacteria group bacterium]|nr:nucleotide exchange factor GrpE [Patescibacteria group bacterium]
MKKQGDQINERIVQLERELTEWKAKYLRALADYQNLEKREAEKKIYIANLGKEEIIKKLLKVLNSLFRAVESADNANAAASWLQGVKLSALEFKRILEQEGLEITPKGPNDDFDPLLHHAVGITDGPDNKIIEVVEMGGILNGKTIEHAKVIVGRSQTGKE